MPIASVSRAMPVNPGVRINRLKVFRSKAMIPIRWIASGGSRNVCRSGLLKSRRLYPEAGLPAGSRRYRLEFFVKALVREIHRVRNARHRFESDKVGIALLHRRPHHDGTPIAIQRD